MPWYLLSYERRPYWSFRSFSLRSASNPVLAKDAAKFSSFFLEGRKRYIAEGTLGKTTTTCDREGEIVLERDIGDALERLESVLEKFRGTITQVPPIYSAIKVNGKALYQYARQGRERDEIRFLSVRLRF